MQNQIRFEFEKAMDYDSFCAAFKSAIETVAAKKGIKKSELVIYDVAMSKCYARLKSGELKIDDLESAVEPYFESPQV